MITNVIREANTKQDIYFLLTAYIEAVRFGDNLNCLPEHVTRLPLTGLKDLRGRSAKLIYELHGGSGRFDDKQCVALKETLEVFDAALHRLKLLEQRYRPQSLERRV